MLENKRMSAEVRQRSAFLIIGPLIHSPPLPPALYPDPSHSQIHRLLEQQTGDESFQAEELSSYSNRRQYCCLSVCLYLCSTVARTSTKGTAFRVKRLKVRFSK